MSTYMRKFAVPSLLLAGWLGVACAQDSQTPPPKKTGTVSRQSKEDRALTAKIRKALIDDKSLSRRAHNVTISSKDGKVTLRGNVDSDTERETVVSKAKEVAGASNVTDNLTVAPPKGSKKTTGE